MIITAIKKGLEANRVLYIPKDGELIYTTDTKMLYIGDGVTVGGTSVNGILDNIEWDNIQNAPQSLADFDTVASETIATLSTQVDKKVEFFRSVIDPAGSWDTDEKTKHINDLWYDLNGKKLYTFDGDIWNSIDDKDALDAYDMIEGKSTIYYGDTQPEAQVNDIWQDNINNVTKIFDGTNWINIANLVTNTNQLTDGAELGKKAVWSSVTGTGRPADGATKNTVSFSATAPTTPSFGDIWTNTADNQLYTYNGTSWVAGKSGADAPDKYIWVKYADTPTTGMSDSPTGKAYIGLAYNKTTATESVTYNDYSWSLIKGDTGATGATGATGSTGATGTHALTCVLKNESHSVPCNVSGTPTSYSASGTDIYVMEGATYLSYVTSITANNQFTVTSTTSGITRGAISAGTSPNRAIVADHSSMTTNPATITYTITAKNSQGITSTFSKVQTFAKALTGATGNTGATGATGSTGATGQQGIQGLRGDIVDWSVTSGIVVENSNKKVRNTTDQNSWNREARSTNSHTGGCYLYFTASQTNKNIMFGINTDPATDTSYTGLDYAFYLNSNNTIDIRESNTTIALSPNTYATTTQFEIIYTGTEIIYQVNGGVVRRVATTTGRTFFVDSSFYNAGAVDNIIFSSLLSASVLRGGILQSQNWGASTGSLYDLNSGTFTLGGSNSPMLSFSGNTLQINGALNAPAGGSIGFGVIGQPNYFGMLPDGSSFMSGGAGYMVMDSNGVRFQQGGPSLKPINFNVPMQYYGVDITTAFPTAFTHYGQTILTGGGYIEVNSSGYIRWSSRFIIISSGRGSHASTSGYYDINCPTSGTIIGVGGASNKTATASGIPLNGWESLYYIIVPGITNTFYQNNLRVVGYTSDIVIPSNWIKICTFNGDGGFVEFANGISLKTNTSIDSFQFDVLGSAVQGAVQNATASVTATKLATARTINGVNFDGSANITLPRIVGSVVQVIMETDIAISTVSIPATSIGYPIRGISITPKKAGNKIIIDALISCEANENIVFKISKQYGQLIGTPSLSSNIWEGIVSMPYDVDKASTMNIVHVRAFDTNSSSTDTIYHIWANSSSGSASTMAINRTLNSTGANNYETGISTYMLTEVEA